jgi:hypothetical protein
LTLSLPNEFFYNRQAVSPVYVAFGAGSWTYPLPPLSSDDPALAAVLVDHVKTVFADYDGKVGIDD